MWDSWAFSQLGVHLHIVFVVADWGQFRFRFCLFSDETRPLPLIHCILVTWTASMSGQLFPVSVRILVWVRARAIIFLVFYHAFLRRFVSIHVSSWATVPCNVVLDFFIMATTWAFISQKLCLVHKLAFRCRLVIHSWNLLLCFVWVVRWSFHFLFSFLDIVHETGSFQFVPLKPLSLGQLWKVKG